MTELRSGSVLKLEARRWPFAPRWRQKWLSFDKDGITYSPSTHARKSFSLQTLNLCISNNEIEERLDRAAANLPLTVELLQSGTLFQLRHKNSDYTLTFAADNVISRDAWATALAKAMIQDVKSHEPSAV